jgi:hypothetical protein
MQERVIVALRWQTIATLPLALAAIALGWWAIIQHAGLGLSLTGWAAIFLGAASIPLLMLQLLRPTRLRLRPDALIIDNGFNQKVVPWRDIEGFYLLKLSAAKFPALRYKEGREPHGRVAHLMRERSGVDETMAGAWPLAPEALVNVLNQCRQELTGGPVGEAAPTTEDRRRLFV